MSSPWMEICIIFATVAGVVLTYYGLFFLSERTYSKVIKRQLEIQNDNDLEVWGSFYKARRKYLYIPIIISLIFFCVIPILLHLEYNRRLEIQVVELEEKIELLERKVSD